MTDAVGLGWRRRVFKPPPSGFWRPFTLSSKLSAEDCADLNLGYCDSASIHIEGWKNREDEGILYVPKAGEILYRLKP